MDKDLLRECNGEYIPIAGLSKRQREELEDAVLKKEKELAELIYKQKDRER